MSNFRFLLQDLLFEAALMKSKIYCLSLFTNISVRIQRYGYTEIFLGAKIKFALAYCFNSQVLVFRFWHVPVICSIFQDFYARLSDIAMSMYCIIILVFRLELSFFKWFCNNAVLLL